MKLRIFAIIFFLFLSVKTYPQYLAADDIGIFDNYFSFLVDNNFGISEDASDEYKSYAYHYYMSILVTMSSFRGIVMDSSLDQTEVESRIALFIEFFETLLNYDVEKELEIKYHSAGWTANGHQKFITILFGSIYVVLLRDSDIVRLMLEENFWEDDDERISIEESIVALDYILERVFKIFNEADLYIIAHDMEFAVRVANTLRSLRLF
jgi:hypothetical protein